MQIAFRLPRVGSIAQPTVRSVRRYAQTGRRCSYLSSLVTCAVAIAVLLIVPLMPTSAEAQGAVDKPAQGEGGCLTEEAKQRIAVLTERLRDTNLALNNELHRQGLDQERLERLQVRLREDEANAKEPTSKAQRAVWERAIERDKGIIEDTTTRMKLRQAQIDEFKSHKANIEDELEKLKGLGPCKDKTAAAPLPPSRPTPLPKPERRKAAPPMPFHNKPPAEHLPPTAFPFGPNGPFETVSLGGFEPRISFGIAGSSATSSYDSTGGQAPFNGDWSHSTGQVCGGATLYPGFVVGAARVGFDVNLCSGSKTFGPGDTTLFTIMRHGPGDVDLRSSTNVIIDTLVKAEVPLGDPEVEYDPLSRHFYVSVGIGPTFREQNLSLTSNQSFFGGGVPSISETNWQTGFAVSAGLSTFVCPTCIAGNPLKVGIEGRARFFPSQSINLLSPVFGFTETGRTGSTTDYSALVTMSVPIGYGRRR